MQVARRANTCVGAWRCGFQVQHRKTLIEGSDSGIERIVSLFPLYYYFKMILVVITAIPNTKFPDFWSDLFLVPVMKKCHDVMVDLDLGRISSKNQACMDRTIHLSCCVDIV